MAQVIVGSCIQTVGASATVYACPMGYVGAYPSTDAAAAGIIPTGGTIDLMAFRPSASPAALVTGTLYLNGSPTSLTCSFSTNVIGHDSTHSVTVAAGDKVSFQITTAAGASSRSYSWSFRFTPNISGETILMGNSVTSAPTNGQYCSIANPVAPNGTEGNVLYLVPESGGIFKKFYVAVDTDPTVPTSTVIFTLYNNSSAGNNVVTIAAGSTSGSDTTHTDTVASAGNKVSMRITTTLAPTLSIFRWGIVYLSATPGNFLLLSSSGSGGLSTGARFVPASGSRTVSTTGLSGVSNAFLAKSLYTRLGTAPGAGTSYDFSFQVNTVDSALLTNVSGTNTTGNVTTNVTVSLDDILQFKEIANTGSPATGGPWQISLLGFLAGPTVTSTNFLMMF